MKSTIIINILIVIYCLCTESLLTATKLYFWKFIISVIWQKWLILVLEYFKLLLYLFLQIPEWPPGLIKLTKHPVNFSWKCKMSLCDKSGQYCQNKEKKSGHWIKDFAVER